MPVGSHVADGVLEEGAPRRRLLGHDVKESTSIIFDSVVEANTNGACGR